MGKPQAACSRSASQDVEVRVIEGFAGLSAKERLAWNALFDEQAHPVPFQSLFWNEAWWKVFGRSSRFATKNAVILVLLHHNEIIGFFPMFRHTLSVLGIPLLRHVKPVGSDPNLTELKVGIVRQGREREAYAALVDYFKDADRRWELVTLPAAPAGAVDAGGMVFEHPMVPVLDGFIIALAADWDAFAGKLKRNVKESIRKCHNSLKRDGLEPVFACLSDPAAIRAVLPEFYRLHGERAKERDGINHPDYFEAETSRLLIDLLASDPVNSGIRLFVLKDGERLIAARLAFETPRGTYLYYSGYDLEYGKYSIMTRLVVEVLKRSIGCGQQDVHMSFGRDVSKTRWSPQEVVYKQYMITQNSLRGRLLAFYIAALKRRRMNQSSKGSPSQQSSASTPELGLSAK